MSSQADPFGIEQKGVPGGDPDADILPGMIFFAGALPFDDHLVGLTGAHVDVTGRAQMFGHIHADRQIAIPYPFRFHMLRPDP